jgi:thiol-disulfide isomerase/thioredoxin
MGIFNKKTKPSKLESLDELQPMLDSGKPVLLDLMQVNCGPCRVMDGIVNELANEYGESAHIVKIDVTKVPGAAQAFGVRSTPTFVLLGTSNKPVSKKAQRKGKAGKPASDTISPRWRQSGLVKKDQLSRVLESNGAARVDP